MNEVSQKLKEARALISEPGTWCTGHAYAHREGKIASCAYGAIARAYGGNNPCLYPRQYPEAVQAVKRVLEKRYFMGALPLPRFSSGNKPPHPWSELLGMSDGEWAIAQFNNSTSQAEVLALFDEAIADCEPKAQEPVVVAERELELA